MMPVRSRRCFLPKRTPTSVSCGVLVVHHARKDSNSSRPGQALRGSSELHAWADSNLYLRRRGSQLTLSTEHRAAPSQIPLQLAQSDQSLALSVLDQALSRPPSNLPRSVESAGPWHNSMGRCPSSAYANSVVCAAPPSVRLCEHCAKLEKSPTTPWATISTRFPFPPPWTLRETETGNH